MKWHQDFRMNNESFPNVAYRRSIIDRYPPILNNNPDFKDKILRFGRENLKDFSASLLYEFVKDTLLLNYLKQEEKRKVMRV